MKKFCRSNNKTKTTAENLEARFDAGDDVMDYFATEKAFRPNERKERVNVDMPHWMILKIDKIAGRKGLARQAQIKEWLADKLKEEEKAAV
jgi:predicted DNA binding CopG/RHH family protein